MKFYWILHALCLLMIQDKHADSSHVWDDLEYEPEYDNYEYYADDSGSGHGQDDEGTMHRADHNNKLLEYLENKLPDLIHEENTTMRPGKETTQQLPAVTTNSITTVTDEIVSTTTATTTTTESPSITTLGYKTSETSTKTTSTGAVTDSQSCESDKDCAQWDLRIEPEFQSHLPGQNITVKCIVTKSSDTSRINSTQLQFTWHFINAGESEELLESNDDTWFVKESTVDNSGNYLCTANDHIGCCLKSASGKVVVYEKPNYLTHTLVIVGVIAGLLLFVCIPMTLHLRRKYWNKKAFEKGQNEDMQALAL